MNRKKSITRRDLLKRLFKIVTVGGTFSLLVASLIDVWMAAGRFSSKRWVSIANINTIPIEGTFPFVDKEIAVISKNGKIAAISLACTHLGCLLNVMEQGFFCPCHGSEFGPLGEVFTGPANRDLPWHGIRLKNDIIYVHSGKKSANPAWIQVNVEQRDEQKS